MLQAIVGRGFTYQLAWLGRRKCPWKLRGH
jgi:hypothetical protein